MSILRWFVFGSVASLSTLIACAILPSVAAAAPEGNEGDAADVVVTDSTSASANDESFIVPDGSAADRLEFIERLANPQQQFTSNEQLQEYLDRVSTAIAEAADRILAGDATDKQTIDAIEWKIEALRIRGRLGDTDSEKNTDAFLAELKFDGRQAVVDAVAQIRQNHEQMRLFAKLREWPRLTAAQKSDFVDRLVTSIKSGGIGANDTQLVMSFADMLADTPDGAMAVRAIEQLLPLFRASEDPAVARRVPLIEGIARRLNLPGNKMELEGKFLDGTTLDWDSYRGKVVLVDFWATWCAPCLAEFPNVLDNYQKYRDQGFEVVGICLDEDRSQAEQVVAEAGIPWPSLYQDASDETGWQHPMAVKYGITGIPTAILVDQQGNVVHMEARGPRLDAELRRLLGAPAVGDASAVNKTDEKRTAQSNAR